MYSRGMAAAAVAAAALAAALGGAAPAWAQAGGALYLEPPADQYVVAGGEVSVPIAAPGYDAASLEWSVGSNDTETVDWADRASAPRAAAISPDGLFVWATPAGGARDAPYVFAVRAEASGEEPAEAVLRAAVVAADGDVVLAAYDDEIATEYGQMASGRNVLENDFYEPKDRLFGTLEVVPTTEPAGGFVSVIGRVLVTYDPRPGFSGADSFEYVLRAGNVTSAPATVSVTVEPRPNRPPVLLPINGTGAAEGVRFVLDVGDRARDPDGDALEFGLDRGEPPLPAAAALDAGTGILEWTPQAGDAGSYNVTVTVADRPNASSVWPLTINVYAAGGARGPDFNRPPALAPMGDLAAVAGLPLEGLDANATDADGDGIRYSAAGLPAGAAMDPATGAVEWVPGRADAGEHAVTVKASDGRGGTDYVSLAVAVAEAERPNRPPQNFSLPGTGAAVGERFVLDAGDKTHDPDGDGLTYLLDRGSSPHLPAAAAFDRGSGVITWTPRAGDEGSYDIVITATDERGASARHAVTVNVYAEGEARGPDFNRPPVLDPVGDLDAAAGWLFERRVASGTDPDGDRVVFRLLGGGLPPEARLDMDTGVMRWPVGAGYAGEYGVTVKASDRRGGTDGEEVTITVHNNTSVPRLAPVGNLSGTAGLPLEGLDADATDADGDAITYSVSGLPAGAAMDPATGALEWTPLAAGTYHVTVTADDGRGLADTADLTVEVEWAPSPAGVSPSSTLAEVNAAIAGVGPGGRVEFAGGVYDLPGPVEVRSDGVTLGPAPGQRPVLAGAASVHVDASGVAVRGLEFAGGAGVRVTPGSGLLLENNTLDGGGVAVCDGGCSGPAAGEASSLIIVRENRFLGGGMAVSNMAQGTLGAPRNFFGEGATLGDVEARVSGGVGFEPWYTGAGMGGLAVAGAGAPGESDCGDGSLAVDDPGAFAGAGWGMVGHKSVTVSAPGWGVEGVTLEAAPWEGHAWGGRPAPVTEARVAGGDWARIDPALELPAAGAPSLGIELRLDLTGFPAGPAATLTQDVTYEVACRRG